MMSQHFQFQMFLYFHHKMKAWNSEYILKSWEPTLNGRKLDLFSVNLQVDFLVQILRWVNKQFFRHNHGSWTIFLWCCDMCAFCVTLQKSHVTCDLAHSPPDTFAQTHFHINSWKSRKLVFNKNNCHWRKCLKMKPLLWSLELNFSGFSSRALWKSKHRSASRPSPK